jgi:MtN3 and saliva related transmembrane protein
MMISPELAGGTAAFFTTVAFLPQAIKTIITKHIKGLSISMLSLQFTGNFLWILYGIWIHSPSVLIANIITSSIVLVIIVTVVLCRFSQKQEVNIDPNN